MTTKTKAAAKTAAPAPAQAPQAAEGALRADIRVLHVAQALPIVDQGEPVEFEPGSIEQFVSKDDPNVTLRIVSADGALAAQVVDQE